MRLAGIALMMTALAACGGDDDGGDHPCAIDGCACLEEDVCDLDCDAEGCVTDCDGVNVCDVSCGDVCDYACVNGSECYLACDDLCTATCDSVSSCEVDCGEDCDVACVSLSECRVVMVTGVVTCDGVSDCIVDCVTEDGLVPAEECGDGVFGCGFCPT
jgi:hypothetical protein